MAENSCVFCDPKSFEETLVAEDENFRIAATRGQITNGGYLLIVPKKHFSCIGAMPVEMAGTTQVLTDKLHSILRDEYRSDSSDFEHGIKGQSVLHAHLHIIPAVLDFSKHIARTFPSCEKDELISIRDLPRAHDIAKEPYLFWRTPGNPSSICYVPDPIEVPKMYLRLVAAELLGVPERGNWRNMDPDLDRRLFSETVSRLRKYFS